MTLGARGEEAERAMQEPSPPCGFGSARAVKTFITLFCLLFGAMLSGQLRADESCALSFCTYLGGSNCEQARDLVADRAGNAYVVGGTASTNFPVTAGAYQTTQSTSSPQTCGGGSSQGYRWSKTHP